MIKNQYSLDLNDAMELTQYALEVAEEINSPSHISIVDSGAHLIHHLRMDNAPYASSHHARNKAWTSVYFRKKTQDLCKDTEPGGTLYGLNTTIEDRVVVFAGGIPVIVDGQVTGALGISGGTADQDHEVATKAVAKFLQKNK